MAMRLFVAVKIPADVAHAVSDMRTRLAETRADVRWAAAEKYHVTVKFLGEVEEAVVGELAKRIKRAAGQVEAFEVVVEGIGRLPERGPARVIIADVISPDQKMTRLHRRIESASGGMG